MQSYNAYNEMCGRCLADRGERPFSDTRQNAEWCKTSPLSNAVFLERIRRAMHPLAMCRQANIFFFRLDVMHVLDHHGTTAIAVASTLKKAIKTSLTLGPNQDARLAAINAKLRDFNRARPSSRMLKRFTHKNMDLDGWAELHGPLIKASVCRHLAPFSQLIANELFASGSVHDVAVRQANDSICKMYIILYSSGMFCTAVEKADFDSAVGPLGTFFSF